VRAPVRSVGQTNRTRVQHAARRIADQHLAREPRGGGAVHRRIDPRPSGSAGHTRRKRRRQDARAGQQIFMQHLPEAPSSSRGSCRQTRRGDEAPQRSRRKEPDKQKAATGHPGGGLLASRLRPPSL
jgi:hypothetical protein